MDEEASIPDIIHGHGEPTTLSELVSALPIHATKVNCVHRLMCMLVHSGFFATATKLHGDKEEKVYVLTPSKVLLKDQANCLFPFVLAMFDPALMTPWQFLGDWMKGEKLTAFQSVHGMGFWDYMDQNPESKNFFHEAMASDSQMMNLVVRDCKPVFEGLNSLVDVGGGTFPHVVANLLESSGNLKFLALDMFESIPSADGILQKLVLRAFGDEDCIKILKRCREAIKSKGGGKGIIIDIVINEKKDEHELTEAKLYFDMLMMALASGRERYEKDWERLFMEAGFSHYKVRPIFDLRSLIEVYP
ncbi:hypothetical protein SLA2020_043850 [Shorea laevis]